MVFNVGLVSLTPRVNRVELDRIAAAIQKQVLRDFQPIWHITGSIDSFGRPEEIPTGYWPVIVEDPNNAGPYLGIHAATDFQPMARVVATNLWSLIASHEILEMLVDPFQNAFQAGRAPTGIERVEYLVEICDPCQTPALGYTVNNEIVSDFVTPEFYEPSSSSAVRYSYSGKVAAPLSVLEGGVLSWKDPVSGIWTQLAMVGGNLSLGPIALPGVTSMGLRERVNRATPEPSWKRVGLVEGDPLLRRLQRLRRAAQRSSKSGGKLLRSTLKRLRPRRRRRARRQ